VLVVLPRSLMELFPGMPHRWQLESADAGAAGPADVGAVIAALDRQWPGVHDRLCESDTALRPYINVYVDSQPAELATPVGPASTVHVLPAVAGG